MISIKSEREIELLRIAGNIVHETREYLRPFIKEGITTIGEGAFQGCSSLSSIVIPENVKNVNTTLTEDYYDSLPHLHLPYKDYQV